MKLKMYFLMLAMGLCSFAMQSCSDDDEGSEVPAALESAFKAKFGDVDHAWTTTRSGKHVAKFTDNQVVKEAWYDGQGDWLMTETNVHFDNLPAAVKAAFAALDKYAGWTRDDVDMLERKGMEPVYVIEVEKGNEEFDLYFDAQGNLLKEVADTEDDSEDYLPLELPESVKALLDKDYPGYKLLDAEREDDPAIKGFLEVEIMLNNQKLEVLYDTKNAWVSTTQEVLFATLPDAVKTAAQKAVELYPGTELDDDEADFVRTPQGDYYVVELEVSGKSSIDVRIDEEGNILK